ncbi:MAG: hypothetical protein OHK0022_21460 [Roseiflexaceae bacterium]
MERFRGQDGVFEFALKRHSRTIAGERDRGLLIGWLEVERRTGIASLGRNACLRAVWRCSSRLAGWGCITGRFRLIRSNQRGRLTGLTGLC